MKNKVARRPKGGVIGEALSAPLLLPDSKELTSANCNEPGDTGAKPQDKKPTKQMRKYGKARRGKKPVQSSKSPTGEAPADHSTTDQACASKQAKRAERAEYRRVNHVDVRGATAPDGTPWVELSAAEGARSAWIPFDDLSDDAAKAKRRMRDAGIVLFGDDLRTAINKARDVSGFPPLTLIERPGWSGPHFALISGEVFSPDGAGEPIVLFEPQPQKCSAKGTAAWRKVVRQLARRQPVVTFAVMIAFAGPLLRLSRLRENIGFELSGPKGVGKSTLQHLATSVVGPALEPAGQNYWITANTTINALEAELPLHNDLMIVIEEMSVMGAASGAKARADQMRELVFRMTQGTSKGRFGTARGHPSRFVYLTSTNDPIASLLATQPSDAALAAGDRLLALPLSPKRRHGIFEKTLPDGCDTGEDAARAIAELVSEHFGHPMRRFLRMLVKARAEDESGLMKQIEGYIAKFRDAVGIDGNAGSEARVADSFGLIYAAGRLAQRFYALPKELDCMQATLKCYRINRKAVGSEITNAERLSRLAKKPGVVTVDVADSTAAYRRRIGKAPALILVGKDGKRELLLTQKALERAFPKPKALFADPAVKPLMRTDAGRHTVKVKLAKGGKATRVYAFRLPADA